MKARLFLVAILLLVGTASCGSESFTREKAADVISKRLKEGLLDDRFLKFAESGMARAVEDGLFVQSAFPGMHELTSKGVAALAQLPEVKSVYTAGVGPGGPTLQISTPVRMESVSIDGIRETSESEKVVDFTSKIVLPPQIAGVERYFCNEAKCRAWFLKYDDGWRLTRAEVESFYQTR